ncbi:MAG: RnfH family protein [Gammaproteobacteria bacterium]|nr:RnfH family protein [Gammaproteobacteria bacterium]
MVEVQISVEVAYARLDMQRIYSLELPSTATVREAIERCDVLREFPEIDLNRNKVGIFGKVTKLDSVLRAGDRVEIYRPLVADPKQARKQRAALGLKMKKQR